MLTSREECVAYECDALTAHRRSPDVVALPRTVDQVQAVMRLAQLHQVPVVARGAGTGLSGGALPVDGAVLLVLARLDRIVELDPERRIARVQPGATTFDLAGAAPPTLLCARSHRRSPARSAATSRRTRRRSLSQVRAHVPQRARARARDRGWKRYDRRRVGRCGRPAVDCAGLRIRGHARGLVEVTVRLTPARARRAARRVRRRRRCADAVGRLMRRVCCPRVSR